MYTIYCHDDNATATCDFSMFTCSMIAMDLSDRRQSCVDLLNAETGEVICSWDCGIKFYDATA